MNISGCRQTQPTLNSSAQVCQNVSKQIVTNDNIVLGGVEHHEHRHCIYVLVIGFNVSILSRHFLENTLPQIAAKPLHVRFIGHCDSLAAVCARVLERGDDNSFDAATCIQFFLSSDLIQRSFFKKSAGAAISPFSILAKDYEI